ncbi:uncharacterized protein LOC109721843 isoform X1 [Ananas comosus]|uniref:Uncharacterized protein LOC109721843 isoform X1 n=1 Tax=Ananas comosus TaxID=4615 RepID=A0A6P5GAN6_ANACO|nr:uncharacterized protein LOC109721843 isoform X1 [Ananas comosus]
MTTSRRLADRKVAKFQKNITKRGSVPEVTVKKGNDYPVGPIVIGFFIFVVVGSCQTMKRYWGKRGNIANRRSYIPDYSDGHKRRDGLMAKQMAKMVCALTSS